ncbi:DUF5693 family protein [Caldinitratiruptor microaerophilus]|uniref:Uncharacterized protein n=1 Tax=Caldinitratiruptor microaerophilus TaxID=671077 RepID=A0AA35CPS0_9FIRM|nr:DUF5693 family protein [Caldinitratiruptor microaerophilus]BDG61706.1 hypothetical protein caldi_27960 [Caldinitratiruptor microaerophilus]
MRKDAFARRFGGALMLVSLVAALPVLVVRHRSEEGSRSVMLAVDLPAFRDFAAEQGYPLDRLLAQLKQAGVTAVAVPERSVPDLARNGAAAVFTGAEVLAELAATDRATPTLRRLAREGRLVASHTYVVPAPGTDAGDLHRALAARLGPERAVWHRPGPGEGGSGVIELDVSPADLEQYGAGWDPADFDLVHRAGLEAFPRPRPAPAATPALVRDVFADLDRLAPEARAVLFWGREVLGFRRDGRGADALAAVAEEVRRRGLLIGMIEHASQLGFAPQEGAEAVARAAGYPVARVYSMGQAEIEKFRPEVTVEKWLRSVQERNIRILYLRPFLGWQEPGRSVVETNLQYFSLLSRRLAGHGYPPGAPGRIAPFWTPWWQRGLVGLGAVGAGLYALALLWPLRASTAGLLAALGIGGALGLTRVAPVTGPQALALATAVVFPALGGLWVLARWGASARRDLGQAPEGGPAKPAAPVNLLREGAVAFVALFGFALLGGLLVAGLLGDVTYALEFRYFRGVKLAFAAPLALVALGYVLAGHTGRPGEIARSAAREIAGWSGAVVRWRHVALGLLAAVAAFWYIQRSGNFPLVPVPEWELALRSALERALVVRPRTKEFAIAYPALALAVVFVHRGLRAWALPFVLAAVTGAVSVVNSFSHLRTPLLVSLVRSVHGLWLGALAGAAAAGLAALVLRWVEGALGREGRP